MRAGLSGWDYSEKIILKTAVKEEQNGAAG